MKYWLRLGLVAIALGATVFGITTTAQAQSALSDEQRTSIKANCLTIKNTMTQLRASDALLRVNRGQVYEAVSSKLMVRFNDRLASHSLDNRGLQSITTNYGNQLTGFRRDYEAYTRQLESALRIDCTQDPDGFHYAVESTRAKRETVHKDIQQLHRFISDYHDAVLAFRTNFERISREE